MWIGTIHMDLTYAEKVTDYIIVWNWNQNNADSQLAPTMPEKKTSHFNKLAA